MATIVTGLILVLSAPIALLAAGAIYAMAIASASYAGMRRGTEFAFVRRMGGLHTRWCVRCSMRLLHAAKLYGPIMGWMARSARAKRRASPRPAICAIGDSNFALWTMMGADLKERGLSACNASFGGATSEDLLTELDAAIAYGPRSVLLMVGENDFEIKGRAGLEASIANVSAACARCRQRGIAVTYVAFARKPGYTDRKWAYMSALELAVRRDCAVIHVATDGFEYFSDGVHVMPSEHLKLADAIAAGLKRARSGATASDARGRER